MKSYNSLGQNLIAIIDDCELFISQVVTFLQDYPLMEITEAMRGMTKLMDYPPSLILLDTKMPTIDGYSVCKFLRSTSCLNKIPIILLTEFDHAYEREYASFVGANNIFCKNNDLTELKMMIDQYIPELEKFMAS